MGYALDFGWLEEALGAIAQGAAMTVLLIVVTTFVGTFLSILGAGALLYSSVLLVAEARLSLKTTRGEMDFLWQQGQRYAPEDILARRGVRRRTSLRPTEAQR